VKPLLFSITCVLAALLVACGGSSKPAASATTPATQAPQATATQPPVAASATPAPTEAPTAAPTVAPTAPPPSGGGGGGGGGPAVSSQATVAAQTLDFVNKSVTARAGNVTLTLQNKDVLVAHNVMVTGFGTSPDCTGPCETSLTFSAGPGSYRFSCTIHPDMVGTLTLVP